MGAAAATVGLDPAALRGGIDNLKNSDLVDFDDETGEIFILDWFRFHVFKSGVAKGILANDLNKIQSQKLRDKAAAAATLAGALELPKKEANPAKSTTYFPTQTSTPTLTTTTPRARAHTREGAGAGDGGGGVLKNEIQQAAQAAGLGQAAAQRVVELASSATLQQQQLLQQLLVEQPQGKKIKDVAAWAGQLARLAAAGQLTPPPPLQQKVEVEVWKPEPQPLASPGVRAAAVQQLAKLRAEMVGGRARA